jgi:hypothetical protein
MGAEQKMKTAIEHGVFQLSETSEPLLYDTVFASDPFEDNFNTIGYRTVAKAPGPIPPSCRDNSKLCEKLADDLAKNYKSCGSEGQGRKECGAGQARGSPLQCPGDVGIPGALTFPQGHSLVQTSEENSGSALSNLSAATTEGWDVEADYSTFLKPDGPVMVDEPLTVRVGFANWGQQHRTVNMFFEITVFDQRGKAVVGGANTRSGMKRISRIQLDATGHTQLPGQVRLPPGGHHYFEHVIHHGLTADSLGSLEIDANDFLQFTLTASVRETGQVLKHEPRRRLADV